MCYCFYYYLYILYNFFYCLLSEQQRLAYWLMLAKSIKTAYRHTLYKLPEFQVNSASEKLFINYVIVFYARP